MELLYRSILVSSLLLLLLILILKLKSAKREKLRLPPGPWQLPIVGSIHHMLGFLPHRILRDMSDVHGPIMHLKLGETSTIVISSPDAAREVLKTKDLNFASRPMINAFKIISYGGKGLASAPYGDYWRRLRKLCALELLSSRRVNSFQSIREEETLSLVRTISSSSLNSINLTQLIKSLTNDITMRAVIGSRCGEQEELLSSIEVAVEVVSGFDLEDLFPNLPIVKMFSWSSRNLWRIHRKLDKILCGIIQEHRDRRASGNPANDLLDALLSLQEIGDPECPLCEDSVKAVIFDVLAGGSETSSTVITWVMTELVRNPRVMIKLQSEIRAALRQCPEGKPLTESGSNRLEYLNLVIKETLRLHTPGPLLLPRECHSNCKVMGYDIPARARLMVNVWAIGRDKRHWGDDVEEFKPERFDGSEVDYKGAHFEFLPFGSGRRICPGISFGVAIVEHALFHLLRYFDWEIPNGRRPEDIDLSETFGATARKKMDLYLMALPCQLFPLG